MHEPRVIHVNDALGNTMHIAVCPNCYNGAPRRDVGEAQQDADNHLANPVSNLRDRVDHAAPAVTQGANVGDWTPREPVVATPVDPDAQRRSDAMARLEARLAQPE
jgi:hypothetical protein